MDLRAMERPLICCCICVFGPVFHKECECGGWVKRTRIVIYIVLGIIESALPTLGAQGQNEILRRLQTVAEQNAEAQAA